jgi:hypothetical protein
MPSKEKVKKVKKGKSKTEQMRELREKNAASVSKTAKATKVKEPKKAKDKKADTVKGGQLVPVIDPAVLKQLQRDAADAEKKLTEGIPDFIAQGANLHAVMEDVTKRELWKFTPVPYKSKTAFVEHYAELAHVSTRTLFGVMGAAKALPGVSAEVKKKIGPRKLQKLAKAVRTLKKKTENPEAELPPEIIEKAAQQPEAEFEETLREGGFVEAPLPPAAETAPMFQDESRVSVSRDAPVEVHSPVASRHTEVATDSVTGNKKVDRAIAVAIQVYDPEMKIDEALEFVCSQWLKSTCDREGYEDMTNDAAADELAKPKNGRKRA